MSKLKRPEKIQTSINGNSSINSATSSPALSAHRPTPASATSTGLNGTTNGVGPRALARPRRDAPGQLMGRGQRTSSAGLRSASIVADTAVTQVAQMSIPYKRTDQYILKRFQGSPPSLVVHLHAHHFRFDQQDSTFTFKSPMGIFLEHFKSGTVPHDLLEWFVDKGVAFYDGCLIVEMHNHRVVNAAEEPSQPTNTAEETKPFSIHNHSETTTPSSWVPRPKDNIVVPIKAPNAAENDASKTKSTSEKDKENMPAPNHPNEAQRAKAAPKKAKITTRVLHPTAMSHYMDIVIKATTAVPAPVVNTRRESRQDMIPPISATGLRPQTPLLAIPSGPLGMEPPAKRQKREKMELDSKNIYAAESQITLSTVAPLFLDPVSNASECAQLLEVLQHPDHSASMPSSKIRKKTVAEMAAEESANARLERFMLLFDDRNNINNGSIGGANPADGEGQAGGASWEPRFERFKAIEAIKVATVEKKKQENIQKAEAAKRQEAEQRERQRVDLLKKQQAEEEARQNAANQQKQAPAPQAQRQQQIDSQLYGQRLAQYAEAQAQAQQQQQLARKVQQMGQIPTQHGHPQNQAAQNGMTPQQQQQQQQHQRLLQQRQQQAQQQLQQQLQASSPVVRNGTPHNLSSPMVAQNLGAAPMQQTNSGMGGSPQAPRPGSAVQQNHPQMTPVNTQAMRTQNSQQSNNGTPRPPNATPNMAQAMPRQMSQTPRMNHSSPMPGQMVSTPNLGQAQMMAGQHVNNPMQAQIAAQQQQAMRAAAAAQMTLGNNGGIQQMSPAQIAAYQRQQMAQQQANGMMGTNAVANNYAAQMRAMAQAQASQIQNGMQQNNPNMMGHQGMPQQMMPSQQQQQQNHLAMQQMNAVRNMTMQIYQNGLQNFHATYGPNPPPEMLQTYQNNCRQQAQEMIRKRQMQAHQVRMQQQQAMRAQQPSMAQQMAMQGMQQRPPGQ